MGAEVFIDLYFLINVSMDFLCLLITGRLLHRRTRPLRMLLSACLGGGYAVGALLLSFGGLFGFAADLLAAMVLCAVAFLHRHEGIGRLLRTSLIFALVSMALGGIMTALYSLLNRLNLPLEVLDADTLSVWIFGLLALVAGALTARGGRWMGMSQKTEAVRLSVVLFGTRVELSAMVDTGNLLADPISGRGVIVAERSRIAHALPSLLGGDRMPSEDEILSLLRTDPRAASRMRLIPTKTATGEGLMVAILPDSLTVYERGRHYSADYLIGVAALGTRAESFDALAPRV